MSLTLGIVGLPNVGKSTLFNALTRNDVLAANYPFATIEPNVGVVPLPDPRLDVLARMFASARTVPATVSFVDIAGIVKGASEGAGLGNKFLANIREADAICQVIRAFADPDVVHVGGRVDPADDIETINTELVLADLQTLEKAVPRIDKEVKGKKTDRSVLEAALAAQTVLEKGDTLFAGAPDLDLSPIRELGLDHGDVLGRVDPAVDVHDVGVLEHAHDLADRVGLTDVGEELIAKALALGSALDDAGDVHEGHGCGQQAR